MLPSILAFATPGHALPAATPAAPASLRWLEPNNGLSEIYQAAITAPLVRVVDGWSVLINGRGRA